MQINSCDPVGQGGQIEEVLSPIWWEMKGIQDEESRNREFHRATATCSESEGRVRGEPAGKEETSDRGGVPEREPKAQSLKVQREQGMAGNGQVIWK